MMRQMSNVLRLLRSDTARGQRRRWVPFVFFVVTLGGSALTGGMLGCSGDTLNGPTTQRDPAQTFWALQLNQHAVSLALTAPYDTIQLTAVPINATGVSLGKLGTVIYKALDSSVTVSSTGFVTAHYVTSGAQLIATLQDVQQRITHTDTVTIQVTPTPDPLSIFSLQPMPGDSAKRALDYTDAFVGSQTQYYWTAIATNTTGDTVCNAAVCTIPVHYASSNPAVAIIDKKTGLVTNIDTGRVVFTATTMAYGKIKRDSVAFTVGYAVNQGVVIQPTTNAAGTQEIAIAGPSQVIMGVGAIVTFGNRTYQPVDMVFDQPTRVDSSSTYLGGFQFGPATGPGNIPAFGGIYIVEHPVGAPVDSVVQFFDPDNYAARLFPVPGTYHVHSTRFPSVNMAIVMKKEAF